MSLEELLTKGNDDEEGDRFEATLHRLREMRAKALTLPDQQRREMAANVAMTIWKMMGLDNEEERDDDSD
jgi:hypothetical protein